MIFVDRNADAPSGPGPGEVGGNPRAAGATDEQGGFRMEDTPPGI